MRISAMMCREQEALQLTKAANEPLANRRTIALAAAKAWGIEAVLAEKRGSIQTSLDKLDTEIAEELALEGLLSADDQAALYRDPDQTDDR